MIKIKLSDKQKEVIKLIRRGWILRVEHLGKKTTLCKKREKDIEREDYLKLKNNFMLIEWDRCTWGYEYYKLTMLGKTIEL